MKGLNGPDSEHMQPGQVLARRVKEARKRRGWSQKQLADELAELGYPLPRSTLAKIEQGGTRADARLGDVLALAAALGVPPVHLIVPLEDEAKLAITSRVVVDARLARGWIRGSILLPMLPEVNLAEVPRSELRAHIASSMKRAGWNNLARAVAPEKYEAELDRTVDWILNPDREEPPVAQPASTS